MERALGPPGPAHKIARYFLGHLQTEFAGGSHALGPFIASLLAEFTTLPNRGPVRCWDVGAAVFQKPAVAAIHQEVWEICRAFRGRVRAFEPSSKGFRHLISKLGAFVERVALSNYTGRGWLLRSGESTGSLGSKGCGFWLDDEECIEHHKWEGVNVTTVDALLGQAPAFLDVLKVDAEGSDWEVALGAARALAEGRIGMVVLEYGDKWSPDLASAVKHMTATHHFGSAKALSDPNLQGVTRWFARHGYHGYLVGMKTPIPINDLWWHDVYEMCQAPHRPHYYGIGKVCYMDVAFVYEHHPFAELVRSMIRWEVFDDWR